jgi:hypothetical protein
VDIEMLVRAESSLRQYLGDHSVRSGVKFLAFPIFLFPKEFFLDGLNKLEERSHKCVELRENM